MNRAEEHEILRAALRVFGYEKQVRKFQEEAGEAIAAAGRALDRRSGAEDAFCEELADLSIMLDQMQLVHGASIGEWRERKLRRLHDRTMMEDDNG